MTQLRPVRTWLGIGLSILAALVLLGGIQYGPVLDALRSVNLAYLAFTVVSLLTSFVVMAFRWKYLLLPVKSVRVGPLLSTIIVGYFFNSILPARAGEVVRAHLLARRANCSSATILATIVLEKVLDGLCLLLFLAFSLLLIPPPPWVRNAACLPGFVFLGCLGALLCLAYRRQLALRVLAVVLRPLGPVQQRISGLAGSFAEGLETLRHPDAAMMAVALSPLVWATVALMFACGLLSFDIHLSPAAVVFMTALVNLGLVVPASPGYLGTYELLSVAALSVFGIDRNLALAFAVLFHACQLLTNTTLGLALFWRQSLAESATPGRPYLESILTEESNRS